MKMILAVMPTNFSEKISTILLGADYRVTKFASTAGFLSGGTTTLMVVMNSENSESALQLIRDNVPPSDPSDPAHARVTIYVLPVKDFVRV
ncbi:MAG: cyclic-di-AMP receptor [Anaerolineales bacterium]|nr:cyclic-di-AMP receptor [Anaerolineales bacterium]